MATKFRIEHTWPVKREVVLAHLFDDELHDRCNVALSSADRSRVSVEHKEGGEVLQRFHVKVRDLPPGATKVLKPEVFEWDEESRWDPKGETIHWRVLTQVMSNKIDCAGELFYVAAGDQTRRVVEGRIEIKIPLAGKVAEKVIVGQLEKTYAELSTAESKYFSEQAG
ncbi:MAG: DUF2505 family protein [Deltaproteobacteria bacterium]|nr:DUF2505 family protein [Deltaproteobacteria bacterium]